VFTRFEGVVNGSTFWQVTAPASDAAFTYGTTAMAWQDFFLAGTGIPNAALQQAGINNFNSALQTQITVAGTKYYITNSNLKMPSVPITGMTAIRTTFVWNVAMAKTAAGTGTFIIYIFRGTNGTIADAADVGQSVGTQTAALDSMTLTVQLTVVTTGATGSYYWSIIPAHSAASGVGFGCVTGTIFPQSTILGTVSGVAMNTAGLQFGLGFSSTTGTPTITVPLCQAFAYNMN
jgi:hypothetical protein